MMRFTAVMWMATAALVAGSLLWLVGRHRTAVQPVAGTAETAAPAAVDLTGGRHWNDPSVPPEILAKAFAPPPEDLPLAARPVRPHINPPEHALSRSQHVR